MRLRTLPVIAFALACRDASAPEVTTLPILAAPPASIVRIAAVQDVSLLGVPTVTPAPTGDAWTFASLLGHEAFRLDVDGIQRSLPGRYLPGKVRVTLAIRLRNLLERAQLIPPTFPVPPVPGVVTLFAVQAVAIDAPGGVTVSSPNEVTVAVPGRGTVVPSTDWDGGPWDYVRSTSCAAPGGTCARFEPFRAPIAAGGASEWRQVGFDIDPEVRHVRLRLLLAADLANVP